VTGFSKPEVNRLSGLSGTKASRAIKTANGITILPTIVAAGASDAVREAVSQARSSGGYDLVIFDGPAMPCNDADRALLDVADGLAAILPANLDINECMDGIIAALGDTERKLIGVVINELHPATTVRQRSKQYA
jgi:methylmalonyl-CoA mutase cobalamin-binding subunit